MKTQYKYRRACKCGNVDFIEFTKIEAAFELYHERLINVCCTKCGGKNMCSGAISPPGIDRELLTIWSENPNYLFCEQDQDLVLAQYENNIDLYLEFIDKESTPIGKRNVLIEALCVMVYERANNKNKNQNTILKKLIEELQNRKELVSNAQYWIMGYIKKVAFPVIGIEYKPLMVEVSNSLNIPDTLIETKKDNLWNRIVKIWRQLNM